MLRRDIFTTKNNSSSGVGPTAVGKSQQQWGGANCNWEEPATAGWSQPQWGGASWSLEGGKLCLPEKAKLEK